MTYHDSEVVLRMIPKEARRCINDDCGVSDVNNCKEDVIVISIAGAQSLSQYISSSSSSCGP